MSLIRIITIISNHSYHQHHHYLNYSIRCPYDHQGLVDVPIFHITQLLGIYGDIIEGDVKPISKKGHLPSFTNP